MIVIDFFKLIALGFILIFLLVLAATYIIGKIGVALEDRQKKKIEKAYESEDEP